MNFTRKSNFSSIIVTKETSDGRSAKARRYSIPLNPIDNTIQLTNGWRLADIRLHIFRFEITRNILSIKPGTFQLEKLRTDELLPKMKESAGFIWLEETHSPSPSTDQPDWSTSIKMLCEILLRLRLYCIAWQIKLGGRRWNWLGSPQGRHLISQITQVIIPFQVGVQAAVGLSHTLWAGEWGGEGRGGTGTVTCNN